MAQHGATASKLFWLGLVVTGIGYFYGATQTNESDSIAGNSSFAIAGSFLSYLFGVLLPVSQMIFGFINSDEQNTAPTLISGAVATLGAVILMFGGRIYAHSKGYNRALGYLGLLGVVGVIVLMFLPDRKKSLQQRPAHTAKRV
jgi:hypothetical protein